jgi:hypothetical protein
VNLSESATVEAEYSVEGGGTGKEFPANLLSDGTEGWNKWYECSNDSSWIKIENNEYLEIRGLGFKSANDCPHRDPDEVTVVCVNDLGEEVTLATYNLSFTERWETITFRGIACRSKKFIFYFKKLKGVYEIQLGQILFYTN